MGWRKIKNDIISLLQQEHWPVISNRLMQYQAKDAVNPLFSALYNADDLCRWHAVSGFGIIVPRIAAQDIEYARVIMRRFLWSLNDESGGIGWGSPESMAEIMAHQTLLFEEYIHMLISYMTQDGSGILEDGNYLELPALQRGLLWGVGRLLSCRNREMLEKDICIKVKTYLSSPDYIVAGLSAWCLGMCHEKQYVPDLVPLLDSSSRFKFYSDFVLQEVSVAEIARQSINGLDRFTRAVKE